MKKQIIASGGIEDKEFMEYVLYASGKPRPRIAFLGTASLDSPYSALSFYKTMGGLLCYPTDIAGFYPDTESILLGQDVIWVGGGSTRDLIALWTARGINVILRKAYHQGVVLAGASAGGNCWFERCIINPVGSYFGVGWGIGLLGSCFCPHYEQEDYAITMLNSGKDGYACESGSAIHFVNGKVFQIYNSRNSLAFQIHNGAETLCTVSR